MGPLICRMIAGGSACDDEVVVEITGQDHIDDGAAESLPCGFERKEQCTWDAIEGQCVQPIPSGVAKRKRMTTKPVAEELVRNSARFADWQARSGCSESGVTSLLRKVLPSLEGSYV
jgi:hypothetical protein